MSKNYITPEGHKTLQKELEELLHVERPKIVQLVQWAASNGDRSENADYIYGKKRLREIDRRLRFLTSRLEIAEVVDPTKMKSEKIQFGATVTIKDEEDRIRTYSIVGVDEINTDKGRISWLSPIGRSLLGKKVGDEVLIQTPGGEIIYEIQAVKYVDLGT